MSKTAIIPLPRFDFDPSEVSIVYEQLHQAGFHVKFFTPSGKTSQADQLMLTGEGLDVWGCIPGLSKFPLVGRFLRASPMAIKAHEKLIQAESFQKPQPWSDLVSPGSAELDGAQVLFLPGGHKKEGMVEYLESPVLQQAICQAVALNKVVASVCHGSLLVARAIDEKTGKSIAFQRKLTGLTWEMEEKAWCVNKIVRFWDRNYYRTYVETSGQSYGYMGVEQEMKRLLGGEEYFQNVDKCDPDFRKKTDGMHRDSPSDFSCSFVVRDGNFISSRWPGDCHALAVEIIQATAEKEE